MNTKRSEVSVQANLRDSGDAETKTVFVSVQANARVGGRYAGATKFLSVLAAALLLAGCVNVHVHFPAAPAEPAPSADTQADKSQ